MEFAAGQHRLQEVPGIHAAFGFPGADNGVQFIDEEDDAAFGLADFLQHGLQPFLKLAAVLGARDERAHIQRKDALILQAFGHIALHNALRQAFGDGRLADARLADQDRVVLGFPREDADHIADLVIAPDDRVHLVFTGSLDQIGAILAQSVVGALGIVTVDRRRLDLRELGRKAVFGDGMIRKDPLDGRRRCGEQADHQMLDRNVRVAHGLGRLFGGAQHAAGFR